jgi:hypothetical protein
MMKYTREQIFAVLEKTVDELSPDEMEIAKYMAIEINGIPPDQVGTFLEVVLGNKSYGDDPRIKIIID